MATRSTKKPAARTTRTKTVSDYIAAAPKDKRAALMTLRRTIKTAAPKASEDISYGIVGFKLKGKRLVYFGYAKAHLGLYAASGTFVAAHAAEVKGYVQSKGTIRFPADEPIPVRLVARIVKARVAEVEESG